MKKLVIVSLCALLLLTGCAYTPKLQDGKEVVAQVNGLTITAEDLYEAMRKDYGINVLLDKIDTFIANKEITDDKGALEYADAQVATIKDSYEQQGQDFAAALKQYGFSGEQEYRDLLVANYKKNKVLENYLKKNITDDEIQSYYDGDNITGAQTVRHILIIPDTTDDMTDAQKTEAKNKALDKAKDLIKKLDEGADFATLAKENSDDKGTASNGGLYANFTADGTDAAFFKASKNLAVNEYTKEPVESEYGYHIILKVSQKEKPALKDVKDYIVKTLVDKKLDEINSDSTGKLYATTFAKIRESYKLEINDTTLKTLYEASMN